MLRQEYFSDTLTDVSNTADMALDLLAALRAHLDARLPEVAPIDPTLIDAETLKSIERKALQIDLAGQDFVNETVMTGKFVKYVDNKFLIRMVSLWPGLVMDGELFTISSASLAPHLQGEALQMLVNGLEDVWWLSADGRDAMSKDIAWRLRYGRALASLRLVRSWQG